MTYLYKLTPFTSHLYVSQVVDVTLMFTALQNYLHNCPVDLILECQRLHLNLFYRCKTLTFFKVPVIFDNNAQDGVSKWYQIEISRN